MFRMFALMYHLTYKYKDGSLSLAYTPCSFIVVREITDTGFVLVPYNLAYDCSIVDR